MRRPDTFPRLSGLPIKPQKSFVSADQPMTNAAQVVRISQVSTGSKMGPGSTKSQMQLGSEMPASTNRIMQAEDRTPKVESVSDIEENPYEYSSSPPREKERLGFSEVKQGPAGNIFELNLIPTRK